MKKNVLAIVSLPIALLVLAFSQASFAQSISVNFENPPYVLGIIHLQDGWSSLGAAGSGCAVYDHAVASSLGTTGFGSQSLRISNSVTSGCFGDQTFSKSLTNEAGETAATNAGYSGGIRQNHFEAQFSFASTKSAQQVGMAMSVSPDRGDGSRMSYLRFEDGSTGINVFFDDVQGTTNPANFVETQVATNLSRTVPHTAKFVIYYLDGPSNDVVKIYIDGSLVKTGTTWENYYRYDSEAAAEQTTRTTDSLIFRTGGTAVPANAGSGFLFDNLSLSSSTGAVYSCAGFDAPMDNPVSVKKQNRVLPLKMVCKNSSGVVLGAGAIAAPIVQVIKTGGADATVPVDTLLSAGQGTDGNEFVFDPSSMKWYFNLQTKNFTGSGTYTITAVGGGSDVIVSSPIGTMIVQ